MQNDEPGDVVGFTCLLFHSPVTEGCVSIISIKHRWPVSSSHSYDNLIIASVAWDLLIRREESTKLTTCCFFPSFSPSLCLQLHNSGPSSIREAELQVGWPSRFRDENLLYAMEIQTDGPISCRTNTSLNPLGLQVSLKYMNIYKFMHADTYLKTHFKTPVCKVKVM